ncbi:MAG: hypothetical protein AAFY65_19920 [Pseudomonadota bacterium]
MYQEDSFFTLTAAQGAGLLALSFALWALAVWGIWRLQAPRLVRSLAALALFWLFVWLSPQVYYAYYQLIFDVPAQWVIGRPPGPGALLRLLTFTQEASLSRHGQGLLGWSLIAMAVGRRVAPARSE